jgi:diguanylate cyclase (GGDEF)-like protein
VNTELVNKVRQCPNLPSLPSIAVQILELAGKPNVDIAEIARLISKDPALSTKILRTVNSSFYGRSQHVGTISHALVILGLQSVKTLVLGFSLVTTLSKDKHRGFNHLAYWRRSIYAATAARTIAIKMNVVQQEEAFLGALLQDIGMLVLDQVLGQSYSEICGKSPTHLDLVKAEAETLGMTHAEVGAILAEQWKLPPILVTTIGASHDPSVVTDATLKTNALLVHLAGVCADVFIDKEAAGAIVHARKIAADAFKINEADCDKLLDEVSGKTKEVVSLFEVNIGVASNYEAILEKANEALVELTLQSQMQATQLQQQNQILQKKATIDALTGLSNRAVFDEKINQHFAAAKAAGTSLTLLMFDVDNFKSVNDRFGHQVGDQVLATLGKLLRGAARPQDLAARYGGEEMALVMPDSPAAAGASLAETIRLAVAKRPIPCGKQPVPVTISIGVATFEPTGIMRGPQHLLKAADMAVYAAKNAGRNCVKVFSVKKAA